MTWPQRIMYLTAGAIITMTLLTISTTAAAGEPACVGGASSIGPVTVDLETGEITGGDLTPHVTGCAP